MRRWVVLGAVVAVLAVSGCVPEERIPTLPPTPTVTPLFATEEEALAAAVDAYAEYAEMSDLIASEGGVDPERIEPFVTLERLEDEYRGFAAYQERGTRLEGSATFEVVELQSFTSRPGELEVTFYACVDLRPARLIDGSGNDITPSQRPQTLLLEIVMVGVDGELPLRLESDEPWSSGPC